MFQFAAPPIFKLNFIKSCLSFPIVTSQRESYWDTIVAIESDVSKGSVVLNKLKVSSILSNFILPTSALIN